MNKICKHHLRLVPADEIQRGDLFWHPEHRKHPCRAIDVFELTNISETFCSIMIDFRVQVIGDKGSVVYGERDKVWKVVGWNRRFKHVADMGEKALASLLDDIRSYPSNTVDGLHN